MGESGRLSCRRRIRRVCREHRRDPRQPWLEISGQRHTHLLGLCGGGQLASDCRPPISPQSDVRTASQPSTIGIATGRLRPWARPRWPSWTATAGERVIKRATRERILQGVGLSHGRFALMRPADGIWNNVVNNYVLGRRPPKMASALLGGGPDQHGHSIRHGT